MDLDEIDLVSSRSVASTILDQMKKKNHDLVIIGAAAPRFLGHFKLGSVAEILAKDTSTSLMIVRGHEGATEAAWKRILEKLKK